ncbi:MAG TPA: pitrilysin family protein [Hyphomicrobiales bacterium]|nr:pitrilysin family protein [Hyphomicrobiales bacterium]
MTVEVSRLKNGMRVVTDAMPHLETAALGVWVDQGARSEADAEHGISHLLEHMAFKGTRRRSARQIAEEIESVGGYLNAATSFEQTAYYARVLKPDINVAIDILGDILRNSVFDGSELAREQSVIVQEIGAARDTPDDLVFDLFQEAAFPGQPIGRTILGTPETVRAFRPDNLSAFLGERYRGPGMVLAAAGAVEHADVVKLAEEQFSDIAANPAETAPPAEYRGGEHRHARELEQAHLVLGFKGVSYLDKRFYAAQMLANILGGGMSSRLFQEVREKRGLCYAIYAFHWTFQDTGLFGIYAATGEGEVVELPPVLAGELEAVAGNLSEEEVARAKAQMKASLMMSLESSTARAEQIARHEILFGRVIPVDELLQLVDSVTADDLKALAEELFTGEAVTLSAVGPLKHLETYDEIAKRFR